MDMWASAYAAAALLLVSIPYQVLPRMHGNCLVILVVPHTVLLDTLD